MATYDQTGCGPTGGTRSWDGMNKFYVLQNMVDLTSYVTADGQLAAGAVHQLLAIPADTLVMQVDFVNTTAAVGTTLTLDLGDGDGHDSWNQQFDGKTAAGTHLPSAVGTDVYAVAASMGKYYTAADSIDLTVHASTAITAGPKFVVSALCVDMSHSGVA